MKDYSCFIFEKKKPEHLQKITWGLQKTANAALVATARVLAEV